MLVSEEDGHDGVQVAPHGLGALVQRPPGDSAVHEDGALRAFHNSRVAFGARGQYVQVNPGHHMVLFAFRMRGGIPANCEIFQQESLPHGRDGNAGARRVTT